MFTCGPIGRTFGELDLLRRLLIITAEAKRPSGVESSY
jgi:hypothetical protein